MKKITLLFTIALTFGLISCKQEPKTSVIDTVESTKENVKTETEVKADLKIVSISVPMLPKSDSKVSGKVIFSQHDDTVSMVANFTGLTTGMHAIHLHEKADCSSADGKSTGGHWNPTAEQHGKWGDATGYHKGDIGNFTAKVDGTGAAKFSTNEWCIGCGDPKKDILGKAVIVHQGTDDFKSQPSGAAGSRVSCGGVIK
ncbi:superoxide dismutase family protein [Pontimicrobium sp. MEBiC06410]